MINETNVSATAKELIGENIPAAVTSSAVRRVKKMLKFGYDSESYDEPLEYLAALYAIRDYLAVDKTSSPTEVSTGEVSVKNSLSVEELDRVIKGETAYLSECLDDPDFIFIGCKFSEEQSA